VLTLGFCGGRNGEWGDCGEEWGWR
jgi:hypothetical protein